MRQHYRLKLVLTILSITVLGCQNNKSRWPEKERNQFLASCVKAGMQKGNSERVAKQYCDCTVSKLEKKFRHAKNITMAAMFEVQEDCKKKIGR